jgi:hypothetical protein
MYLNKHWIFLFSKKTTTTTTTNTHTQNTNKKQLVYLLKQNSYQRVEGKEKAKQTTNKHLKKTISVMALVTTNHTNATGVFL